MSEGSQWGGASRHGAQGGAFRSGSAASGGPPPPAVPTDTKDMGKKDGGTQCRVWPLPLVVPPTENAPGTCEFLHKFAHSGGDQNGT